MNLAAAGISPIDLAVVDRDSPWVVGPFNVNSVTQQTTAMALEKWSYFKKQIEYVVNERKWLMKNLQQIDVINPYPSDTNFSR